MRSLLRSALAATAFFVMAAGAACAPAANTSGPALWRLSDSDSEIWLFGTVHMLAPRLKWRTARIEEAFKEADTLYLETPVDNPSALGGLIERYGYNPKGVSLSNLLNDDDKARLGRICRRFKIDQMLLERGRPWLVGVQLTLAQAMAEGSVAHSGVDQALDRDARRQHKLRGYFETPEQQIRFFADLPPAVELQFLRTTMREIEDKSGETERLGESWSRGDISAIAQEVKSMDAESGSDFTDHMLRDRNARWADAIAEMMKGSGKTFIAVGAAHLVGDEGVPALLRKKGFHVEGP